MAWDTAGKVTEHAAARQLGALGWTLADIAEHLGVAKSSVSLWVPDVEFEPQPRRRARRRGPNVLQRRKAAEIEALKNEEITRLGTLSEQAFLAAGAALYAGEGRSGTARWCSPTAIQGWWGSFAPGSASFSISTSRV